MIDDDNCFQFEFNHLAFAADHFALMQPMKYLEITSRNMKSRKSFAIVQDMFTRYKTIILSPAPAERFFSSGGQIMTPRRNGHLSDETFEKLLLLRQNYFLDMYQVFCI
jgi:hypothetical protein